MDKLIEHFFGLDIGSADPSLMREFLRTNSHDPDFKAFANAMLLQMIEYNYTEAVQALVEFGADVNAPNTYGATSIYFAVRTGNRSMIRFLLSKGAKLDVRGHSGETLSDVAAFFGHDDLVSELVEMGVPKSANNPLSS